MYHCRRGFARVLLGSGRRDDSRFDRFSFSSHHIRQVAAPESVLKRRKRDEQWKPLEKAKDAAEAKKAQEKKREEVFKRAEKYVKEYEAQEKDLISLKREAERENTVEPEQRS